MTGFNEKVAEEIRELRRPKIAYATRDGDGYALFAKRPVLKTEGAHEFWEGAEGEDAVYSDPDGFTDIAEILTLFGITLEEGECKRLEIRSSFVSKTTSFSDNGSAENHAAREGK